MVSVAIRQNEDTHTERECGAKETDSDYDIDENSNTIEWVREGRSVCLT